MCIKVIFLLFIIIVRNDHGGARGRLYRVIRVVVSPRESHTYLYYIIIIRIK